MNGNNESNLTGYPSVISYGSIKKIIEQMENSICKIKIGEEQGTGFFCKIPFPDKNYMLPVMITNNHIINYNSLYNGKGKLSIIIKAENVMKDLDLNLDLNNRMKYTNEVYDITIIEIKEKDNIKNYLELDDDIISDTAIKSSIQHIDYMDKTIYIIQYPEGELSVSFGTLNDIYANEKYNFKHRCSTRKGSSGSPILNANNNKIIGIHKKSLDDNNNNLGSFLNYAIKDFIQINYNEALLKELNSKYRLDIRDTKVEKLDLRKRWLIKEILKDLSNIEFEELKYFYLSFNEIADIRILEKFRAGKLEKLELGNNNITDISVLEKTNFKELKQLLLYKNKISDINVLGKVNFEKLEILNLNNNNIKDINILENVNFNNLKELYLNGNKITNIKVLERLKFEKLEKLELSYYNNRAKNILFIFNKQKIIEQLIDKICKIKIGTEQGIGCFCKVPFPDKNNMLPILITNNIIIDDEILNNNNESIIIKINGEKNEKEFRLTNDRIKYTNKDYDTTIIEIKENEDEIKNYLELDDIIINDIINNTSKNEEYLKEIIYIIQYQEESTLNITFSILDRIYQDNKYNFNYKVGARKGTSSSLVLNINKKLIGIDTVKVINNYSMGTFLNYPLKEFIQSNCYTNVETLIKDFNQKYNSSIEDTKVDNLNLSLKYIGNEGFKDLCKIGLNGLKNVDLNNNNISDINELNIVRMDQLEYLNLGDNRISDLNIIGIINLNNLRQLFLYNNKIQDINFLGNANLENLMILNIGHNDISDISILEKANFKRLKELYLYENNISDINILKNVKLENLEIINLGGNRISDISVLQEVNYTGLKELYLYNNNISDINVLEKVKFENLEKLNFGFNKISDISVLSKVNFKRLNELHLYDNFISDISVFENTHFDRLRILKLVNNKIDKNRYILIITKLYSMVNELVI